MTVGRGPRLGADGVNAINEETGGAWPPLLAPLSGVWKLVKPAGRLTSNYVPFSPPGFLGRATAKKRICIQPRHPWVDGLWVWVDCWPRVTSFSVSWTRQRSLVLWITSWLGAIDLG